MPRVGRPRKTKAIKIPSCPVCEASETCEKNNWPICNNRRVELQSEFPHYVPTKITWKDWRNMKT